MSRWRVALAVSSLTATLLIYVPGGRGQRPRAPDIPVDFDLGAAMKALYGNYDPDWRASTITLDNRDDGAGPYAVLAFYLYEYNDSGKRYVLMATDAIPARDGVTTAVNGGFDCHACQPLVGAALFLKKGPKWEIEASEVPNILDGFSGGPPDGDFFQFGPHHVGLRLLSGYSSMGGNGTNVLLLVPWNGHFSEAAFIGTEQDNEGNDQCVHPPVPAESAEPPCYSGKTDLSFVRGKNPEYYDLVLKSSGTDETEIRTEDHMVYGVQDISRTKRMRFVDGKYIADE